MFDFEKMLQNKIVWLVYGILDFTILFLEGCFYFAIADMVL